jgi:hypothetical protein
MNPYWFWIKWGAALTVLALVVRFVYGKGYDACELKHLKAEQSLQEAAVNRAVEADKKLQAALKAAPKTGQRVREVIRNAPSDCSVNPAAVDRLRDGIRAANEATSG